MINITLDSSEQKFLTKLLDAFLVFKIFTDICTCDEDAIFSFKKKIEGNSACGGTTICQASNLFN